MATNPVKQSLEILKVYLDLRDQGLPHDLMERIRQDVIDTLPAGIMMAGKPGLRDAIAEYIANDRQSGAEGRRGGGEPRSESSESEEAADQAKAEDVEPGTVGEEQLLQQDQAPAEGVRQVSPKKGSRTGKSRSRRKTPRKKAGSS